jgi:hypothetical protein
MPIHLFWTGHVDTALTAPRDMPQRSERAGDMSDGVDMTMITSPNVIATPMWPSALVSASTMIAPQPAKTSADVPMNSAAMARASVGRRIRPAIKREGHSNQDRSQGLSGRPAYFGRFPAAANDLERLHRRRKRGQPKGGDAMFKRVPGSTWQ